MRSVKSVEFDKGFVLRVCWMDGTEGLVNLVGLVERSRHFKVFLDHPEEFRDVKVVGNGIGIEWENGLDYSAESLWRMLELQRPVQGKFFQDWMELLNISNQEAADVLGVSLATVKKYRGGSPIPRPTVLACKAIAENKDAVYALYRPRRAGRPELHN